MAKQTSPKKTTAKNTAGKQQPASKGKGATGKQPAKKAPAKQAPPKKAGGKGPGVIASIVEFLQAATEAKPISKQRILEKLVERFPDRKPGSMRTTIGLQCSHFLKKLKGLDVRRNSSGYWIAR